MLVSLHILAISITYIQMFVMLFIGFSLGYLGAILYVRLHIKKLKEYHIRNTKHLKNTIKNLKEELDQKGDGIYRKDRMNQDFDNVQIQARAFSDEVISQKVKNPALTSEENRLIEFSRIGTATVKDRDNLQLITGIGPYTEARLNELEIYTFEQISKFTTEDIQLVTKLIKFFPDRIKEDRWVSKAKYLKNTYFEDNTGVRKK